MKGDGRIQKMIGKFLQSSGEFFYVGARREEGSPETLFKWDSDQEVPVHQYAEGGGGDCLTVGSSGGAMVAKDVDCSRKMKPLCIRMDNADSNTNVGNVCDVCSSDGESCLLSLALSGIMKVRAVWSGKTWQSRTYLPVSVWLPAEKWRELAEMLVR